MEYEHKIILGVVLVILILFIFARANNELYNDMLTGMWVSDPEWAERADLDGMLLYVGQNESWFGDSRKCYLILHADNRVIVSKQIEMNVSSGTILVPMKSLSCSVEIRDLDEDDTEKLDGIQDEDDNIPFEDIMPRYLTLELGISSAKLILTGNDESGEEIQYAKLFKDAAATDVSRNRREEAMD